MVATLSSNRTKVLPEGARSPDRGVSTWREEFFVYGRSSDRRDARNRYRFIGVERDEDTGLCMTGPRTYDPVSGRFLQGDPVVKAGTSPFAYASCSPVIMKDPGGYDDTLVQPEASIPVKSGLNSTATQVGTLTAARPPPTTGDAIDAYKAGTYKDTQFDKFTEGMGLDFLSGMVQGADALANTWSAKAGEVVGNFVPFGHGDRETLEGFAKEPGVVTGALAAATIVGVPLPAGRNGALLEMSA